MNVSLPPELERYVNQKVATGLYTSASEVVREGLRLLKDRDHASAGQLSDVQAKVALGLAQLDRGERVTPTALRAELRKRSRARRGK